jgi:hypothetical protein
MKCKRRTSSNLDQVTPSADVQCRIRARYPFHVCACPAIGWVWHFQSRKKVEWQARRTWIESRAQEEISTFKYWTQPLINSKRQCGSSRIMQRKLLADFLSNTWYMLYAHARNGLLGTCVITEQKLCIFDSEFRILKEGSWRGLKVVAFRTR